MAGSTTTTSIFLVGNQSETGIYFRRHPVSYLVTLSWLEKTKYKRQRRKEITLMKNCFFVIFFLNEEVDTSMGKSGLSLYLQSFLIWCPIYGVPTSRVITA